MFGAIVILFLSIAAFYLGYQGIRHKRTFWFEDGEKNNKKSKIGRSEMFPLILWYFNEPSRCGNLLYFC